MALRGAGRRRLRGGSGGGGGGGGGGGQFGSVVGSQGATAADATTGVAAANKTAAATSSSASNERRAPTDTAVDVGLGKGAPRSMPTVLGAAGLHFNAGRDRFLRLFDGTGSIKARNQWFE